METAKQGYGLAVACASENHGHTVVCLRLMFRLVQEGKKVKPAAIGTKRKPASRTRNFDLRQEPVA